MIFEYYFYDDLISRGDSVLFVVLDVVFRRVKKFGSFRYGYIYNLVVLVSFLFKRFFERREEVVRLVGKGMKKKWILDCMLLLFCLLLEVLVLLEVKDLRVCIVVVLLSCKG